MFQLLACVGEKKQLITLWCLFIEPYLLSSENKQYCLLFLYPCAFTHATSSV